MSTPKEVKLQLMAQAVHLAAPIVAAAASKVNVAVDPTIQDAGVRQLNLFAFEIVQVLFNALRLAFENNDANAWPDPVTATTPAVGSPSAPVTPVPSPGANLGQFAGTAAQIAGAVATAAS